MPAPTSARSRCVPAPTASADRTDQLPGTPCPDPTGPPELPPARGSGQPISARWHHAGVTWDPELYLRFAEQRARPFADLLARIDVQAPARVVDLGCGPGTATVTLLTRWP